MDNICLWQPYFVSHHNKMSYLCRGPFINHSSKVLFQKVQWFLRGLICKKFTENKWIDGGHQVMGIAHITLWKQWCPKQYINISQEP